jgi:anti-sigma B factor antagonist
VTRGSVIRWHDEQRGDGIVALPIGRVDESTVHDFSAGLDASVEKAAGTSSKALVVDMSGLEYMSSRGLRSLTLAKRKGDALGVTITLAAPNAVMREILAISRYDKIFTVSEGVDAAP